MREMVRCERFLLLLASAVLINGLAVIQLLQKNMDYKVLGAAAAIVASWFAAHVWLRVAGHSGDPLLLPLAALLSNIGLIMVLRLTPNLFFAQTIWILLGVFVFVLSVYLAQKIENLATFKYVCGFTGIILLMSAILFGVDIGGHKSWVILGPIRFQPSEFAKLFIVIFLAAYLNERREVLTLANKRLGPLLLPHPRFVAPLVFVWGVTMLMLVLQRDMGSALLYFSITIIMTYMASGRLSYPMMGFVLFFAGSVFCYYYYPHIQTRIDIWIDPWADPSGKAYQIVQSLFALGSGGVLGTGLMYGFPTMIPEVHTDFIFAAIGEELGLMGTGAILLSYIILVYRSFRTALLNNNSFIALVASGFAVIIGLQTFLIVAGVTKFFPLTGITLPLISYGGSSILSNCILLGILFTLSEMRPNYR
ncbi:putative membrane protein [Propionispora sp. 2/2-37]|uniref:FtsW/RodA/SpoVE family cell cycle protein n=1 Tax=Propionispora sp. 2/2-37 TaxID=1677858 RepID=UPI0006BB98C6|nr:FtsW/RodA/SpoVE family cell cycle protein [Propionispora sp. 2/2-37]CUH94220.1 putative membrane protein [Propionispora sp. 2/2-37]